MQPYSPTPEQLWLLRLLAQEIMVTVNLERHEARLPGAAIRFPLFDALRRLAWVERYARFDQFEVWRISKIGEMYLAKTQTDHHPAGH